ncbi:TnsA-like heteromeric transposase endonuclease subunit [Streptomyces sp. NPDC001339]|uniref:TnsA-like heteromeric transposase endonuclease subunit n=1 Tax=Streptomyces sp. NPDC001339 TaxID=3364563 RepID=UPI0036B2522E
MYADAGAVVCSDRCGLEELIAPYTIAESVHGRLLLGGCWTRSWTTSWSFDGDEVVWPVRDLAAVPLLSSQPVRRFTWRARQRHRPGLQFLVSTSRHHGFESLEEQRLLLALDFLRVQEVLPQPFRLEFAHAEGRTEHTPDFLAVMADGSRWLFDVRPGHLIKELDALKFAASDEAAFASGWRYAVVTGWRRHVWSVLDALSAQRRHLDDPLRLQQEVLGGAAAAPVTFGELVRRTSLPAVARAHALHLLWHRRLGVDLGRPLDDDSMVWSAEEAGA